MNRSDLKAGDKVTHADPASVHFGHNGTVLEIRTELEGSPYAYDIAIVQWSDGTTGVYSANQWPGGLMLKGCGFRVHTSKGVFTL